MNTISQWFSFPSIVDAAIELQFESRKTPYVPSSVCIYANNPDKRWCNICNKEISRANFARHRRVLHPDPQHQVAAAPAAAAKRGPCVNCGLVLTLANMTRHKRKCRNGEG